MLLINESRQPIWHPNWKEYLIHPPHFLDAAFSPQVPVADKHIKASMWFPWNSLCDFSDHLFFTQVANKATLCVAFQQWNVI